MDLKYFASLPTKEIGDRLVKKIEDYYCYMKDMNHYNKIKKTYEMYFGLGRYAAHKVHARGEEGEYLNVVLNHLRSVIKNILVLTMKNRPTFKAVAINSDANSQSSARLGDYLIDYYMKLEGGDKILKKAGELALITSKSHIVCGWDVNKGKEYMADSDNGEMLYDGDIALEALSCLDVVEDLYTNSESWKMFRLLKNKYDLAAQFPEKADKIIEMVVDTSKDLYLAASGTPDEDLVAVWTFRHNPTPAVPEGREVIFLSGDCILIDQPLPYRNIAIYPLSPGIIHGTNLGFTPAFDLLALNDVMNEMVSIMVTNMSTFGYQNIWTPPGSELQAEDLSGGLRWLRSTVKPEAVQLTALPDAAFKAPEFIQQQIEILSGINAVIRGAPQASLESGAALALVATQAIQYNSDFEESLYNAGESMVNGIISILQTHATTKKVALIVGQNSTSMVQEFQGEDLLPIYRVFAEPVNPVSKTAAGRMDMANSLLNTGLFKNAQEYLQVVESGSLSPLLESETSALILINKENEMLRKGQEPQALMTDDHGIHIRGHRTVLDDPMVRQNPTIVQAALTHMQEHILLSANMDPNLGAMLREEAPVAPAQGQLPQPGSSPSPSAPESPVEANMPSMPANAPESMKQDYEQSM